MLTRREFSMGASALAISAMASHPAKGRFPHGASGFNGGRLQVNIGGPSDSGEFSFLNVLKAAPALSTGDLSATSTITPDVLDANGYPISTTFLAAHTGVLTLVNVPTQTERPGNYCVTWDGSGTIAFGNAALASCSFTGSISGNVLTVSALTGTILLGQMVAGSSVTNYTIIMNQLTGSVGAAGTYTVSISQTKSGAMTASGGSVTSSGGVGAGFLSCTVPNVSELTFKISSIVSAIDYISNVQIFHVDDAALVLAGSIFGTKFKQRLIEGNYGVLRFISWMDGNINNSSTWNTRKSTSYLSWNSHELRPSLYCGATTAGNSTGAYATAAFPAIHSSDGTAWSSGAPKDKDTVHVLITTSDGAVITGATAGNPTTLTFATGGVNPTFSAGQAVELFLMAGGSWASMNGIFTLASAGAGTCTINFNSTGFGTYTASSGIIYHNTCTFDVGGGGAKNMLDAYSRALSGGGNSYPIGGSFRSLATLVYDSVLDAWIKQGGDLGENSVGILNGVPFEVILQLCVEVGAHPHLTVPQFPCNPLTDYIPNLATYFKTNGPSWMHPRYEGPNETWNSAAGFYTTGYANSQAAVLWAGGNFNDWYGKVMSVMGQALANIYSIGNLGNTYSVLCAVQTAGDPASQNDRMSAAKYVAQAGAPQSPYTKTAASGWVSHVCNAQYFTPSNYNTATETTEATAYNGTIFTGSISGTTLTITSMDTTSLVGTGNLAVGDTIYGVNVPVNTTITVGSGGVGTYTLSNNCGTIASQQFTSGHDLTQAATYVDTCNSGAGSFTIAACAAFYSAWKTWAQGFGVQKMCGYEGGYSPDYIGGNGTTQVNLFRSASKRVASSPGNANGIQGYCTMNYNNFVSLTGGGFVAEFPSRFLFGGQTPSTNAWSMLEDIYQSPNPPQFTADILFNH